MARKLVYELAKFLIAFYPGVCRTTHRAGGVIVTVDPWA